MHKFKIDVIFRKYTPFCRHNADRTSAITGTIELTTARCDVEPILADYNVESYKISDCDYRFQIMKDYKPIPKHYYEEDK